MAFTGHSEGNNRGLRGVRDALPQGRFRALQQEIEAQNKNVRGTGAR
jgi:hypothetical protein